MTRPVVKAAMFVWSLFLLVSTTVVGVPAADTTLPLMDSESADPVTLGSSQYLRSHDASSSSSHRQLLYFNSTPCNQARAKWPDSECTCRLPSILLNRGFTVNCASNDITCIPPLGCFQEQYNGEFFLIRRDRASTGETCLSEITNRFDVICIGGAYCSNNNLNCYRTCSARVGNAECTSCEICPDGQGRTVDCRNINPILAYSDCEGGGNNTTNSTDRF
jgi:hypothetical protein